VSVKPHVVLVGMLGAMVLSHHGRAEDLHALFEAGVRSELFDGEAASRTAFALYARAAQAGLPEAEFNTAVLLDSGRGVRTDTALAATWYARAAAHGHERAAYNLGQLYDAGEGAPRNPDLARAWFAASNLPAALARAARPASSTHHAGVDPPTLVSPRANEGTGSDTGLTEFVWTVQQQSEPAQFLVEICAVDDGGPREVFSGISRLSSLTVLLPRLDAPFAWRVTTILPKSAQYAAGSWVYFNPAPHVESASR
jgi:hypothetical protein